MRCSQVQQKLDPLTTQELTSSERERIEAHLQSCAGCHDALARLRRLEKLLAASPAPPVPEGFAAQVVARAKEQQAAVPRRAPRPRFARPARNRIRFAAATAAALTAGLMLGLFMGRETWRSDFQRPSAPTSQPADLLVASGLDALVEPGGGSLAQTYLQMTTATDR
jgi:anti-sigma factor RsiW